MGDHAEALGSRSLIPTRTATSPDYFFEPTPFVAYDHEMRHQTSSDRAMAHDEPEHLACARLFGVTAWLWRLPAAQAEHPCPLGPAYRFAMSLVVVEHSRTSDRAASAMFPSDLKQHVACTPMYHEEPSCIHRGRHDGNFFFLACKDW